MNCEQRTTLDYIPGTAATIGVTADGITDTLDLKQGILNVETRTHLKLNGITGNIEFWNEDYAREEDPGFLQIIRVPDLLSHGSLEDLGNVAMPPKNGDILYYKADAECGPDCVGINDSWVKLRAPTEDGTYRLTMVVEGGEPTIEWRKI